MHVITNDLDRDLASWLNGFNQYHMDKDGIAKHHDGTYLQLVSEISRREELTRAF